MPAMEIAGLTLGIASAVGVIGQVFDGCVKAYAFFTTAKNIGRDSERLVCKIRIEEMRLTVWGREWGVAEGRLEQNLAALHGDNVALKNMAEMILKQLLDTIGNTRKLRERYGVKAENAGVDEKLSKKAIEPSNPSTWRDISMKAKWVIGDKDKFEMLLKELKDFNDGLERLFPPSRIATLQRTWTNELLQSAQRDVLQLHLLEDASSGVYQRLNTSANLKQLRINLDAKMQTKFKPTSELKILKSNIIFSTSRDHKDEKVERVTGIYQPPSATSSSSPEPVIVEWVSYDPDSDLDARLVVYQRIDNLARMIHSASNRHPDLHALDCIGYIDDSSKHRHGLTYRAPASSIPATLADSPIKIKYNTLTDFITSPHLRTPNLEDRFNLAHTLSIALWSFHSLDWLHKTVCSTNILFFPPANAQLFQSSKANANTPPDISVPYLTGFSLSRPSDLAEASVAPPTSALCNSFLYRHPDSLGLWRQPYRKGFDIYSLGLVLLEIGLWKDLREFWRDGKHGMKGWREKIVMGMLVGRLGSRVGTRYLSVVEKCLEFDRRNEENGGEGKDSTGNENREEQDQGERVGRLMEWVVLTLENLRV